MRECEWGGCGLDVLFIPLVENSPPYVRSWSKTVRKEGRRKAPKKEEVVRSIFYISGMKGVGISVVAACVAMLWGCGRVAQQPEGWVNLRKYEVAVGDTVKIYYTTNSCCVYCSNKHELTTLDFVGEKVVTPNPEGCAGCNATSALVFVAKQAGTDTVRGKVRAVSEGCADLGAEAEEYIVAVQ